MGAGSRCSGSAAKKSCIQQRVPIRLTACHLGGVRPWFVCPVYCDGRYCGRRAAILYSAGELFACRRCYGLAYESQQQTAGHRGLEQARKIRMRLGGGVDLLEPFPARLKAAGPRGSGNVRLQSLSPLIAHADPISESSLALIGTGMDPATVLMVAPIDTETAYPRPFRASWTLPFSYIGEGWRIVWSERQRSCCAS